MLESPKARRGLRAWLTDLLELDALDGLQKDPLTFVHAADALGRRVPAPLYVSASPYSLFR